MQTFLLTMAAVSHASETTAFLHGPPTSRRARPRTRIVETERYRIEHVGDTTRLGGELHILDAEAIWRELRATVSSARKDVLLDLSDVRTIDGSILSMIVMMRTDLASKHLALHVVGAHGHVEETLALYDQPLLPRRRALVQGFVVYLGRATAAALAEARLVVEFLGTLASETVAVVRWPRTGNWRNVPIQIERAGIDALPIVLLINFLVGVVTALQSVTQLRLYGANVYVADIVGLGTTREIAPLITAIVVCGRSGASFAAEIGTMKASEEVDAMRVMGLGPVRYLVIPRMLALFVAVPLLTLTSAVVGILGGAVIGYTLLDVTLGAFLAELRHVVGPWDVITGLVKSLVYAGAIGLIGCQQGFATTGGASGVGKRTTSTIVATLVALVSLNATATALFQVLDK